jgi:hypothetical protein
MTHGIESEPRLAARLVRAPAPLACPLRRPISTATDEARPLLKRGVKLLFEDVNGCAGEVLDPAGMIEI